MRLHTRWIAPVSAWGAVLLFVGATPSPMPAQQAHADNVTGHAAAGRPLYERYCVGCHGKDGDGAGDNAQWIDPRPRDFTLAVFKCRSTATGSLPTDQDLYNAVSRGFVSTYMPPWFALTPQNRIDVIAYIKTFSAKWNGGQTGTPITIPDEPAVSADGILHGRQLFQDLQCWKCHGPAGHGDGPAAATLTDSKDNPIRPYDFVVGSRFKCGSTNRDLYQIFMTGLDGTPMPSFADLMQPGDAWDLVHFLRTLQPLASPEATTWRAWLTAHPGELKPIGPEGTQ